MDPVETSSRRRALAVRIEARDALFIVGAGLVVVDSCVFHWALGLIAIGIGLCGLAWRLSLS